MCRAIRRVICRVICRVIRGVIRRDDRGSTTPLILGFFVLALLFSGGAVAISDAFTRQRELQSTCDGAALAAANTASGDSLHGSGTAGANAIPLGDVDTAIRAYLARDPARSRVSARGAITGNGTTVDLVCTQRTQIAFERMFGRAGGIVQTARSSARSPLGQ